MFKKILIILTFIGMLFYGCTVKPLYLQGDVLLNVNITTEVSMAAYWNMSVEGNLIYDWDTTLYGPIGYTAPEFANIVILNNGNVVNRKLIQTGKRQMIDVELNKTYDFLIFNKTDDVEENYVGNRYYLYTPTMSTRSVILGDEYFVTQQPGEVFSTYQRSIYLSDDIRQYEEVYDNGKLMYVYNIDADIHPFSYIYLVQFIIVNDDHTTIEAKDITNFTVAGVADMKNLFDNKTYINGNREIVVNDIKPGQVVEDSLVFASRFTTLGLSSDDEGSSWIDTENYLYYTGVNVNTYSYGTVSGLVNITQQMKAHPKGGIITIRILNSDLKKGAEKISSGIDVDVEEWEYGEVVVIEI